MSIILLAVVMAVIVEAIIEYGKTIWAAVEKKAYKTVVTQLAAIALSVCLCLAVQADVFAALGINFNVQWIGILLTGVFASRGSNYVSDFVKKLQTTIGR